MAHLDAAARLADGRTAVEHTQTYVDACRALGYQHPDLTAHGSQVRDWYDTETGLDLGVLDADCAALWAAVNVTEEALAIQRAQAAELAATWRGLGAKSAAQFLQRHCEAGAAVAAHVRAAAERCSALCDDLWRIVDGKVATAIAVDDRSQGRRSAWLAAAQTVATGGGDRSTAEELVRQELIPHVDNDIRGTWLTAMRSAADSVSACYDATIDALTAVPRAYFEIPSDLGPQPPLDEPSAPVVMSPAPAVMPAASTVPAAAPPALPPAPPPGDMFDGLGPAPPLSDLTAPLGDMSGIPTGAGGLGGLGGLAGNIGGVVGKIVDGIGALIGSLADGLTDPEGLGEEPLDEPLDLDDDPLEGDADETDDDAPDDTEPATADEEPAVEDSDEKPVAAEDIVTEQATPPPAEPARPPQPETQPETQPKAHPEGETPCQIAADELPQAGQ